VSWSSSGDHRHRRWRPASEGRSIGIARFFGNLSYPLYISHYPLIYIFTARVIQDKIPLARGTMWGAVLFVVAVSNAYACMKLYDEPSAAG